MVLWCDIAIALPKPIPYIHIVSLSRNEHFSFSFIWTFLIIFDSAPDSIDNVAVHCLVIVKLSLVSMFLSLTFIYAILFLG